MEKFQLIHPEGKHAPRIDKAKYDLMRTSFLKCLSAAPGKSFDDYQKAVEKDLKTQKIKFEGSLQWYLFSVTLDLEARKEIKRDKKKSPMTYSLP